MSPVAQAIHGFMNGAPRRPPADENRPGIFCAIGGGLHHLALETAQLLETFLNHGRTRFGQVLRDMAVFGVFIRIDAYEMVRLPQRQPRGDAILRVGVPLVVDDG